MRRTLAVLWVSPNSMLGLVVGLVTLATGGRAQVRRGALEFYGGFARWMLERFAGGTVLALTLGHTVIGVSAVALDISRDHEHIHIRQYETWGPLFLPAYGWCSLVAWWTGGRAYRDNYFEREAYGDDT